VEESKLIREKEKINREKFKNIKNLEWKGVKYFKTLKDGTESPFLLEEKDFDSFEIDGKEVNQVSKELKFNLMVRKLYINQKYINIIFE
jgi:hypothetical protein